MQCALMLLVFEFADTNCAVIFMGKSNCFTKLYTKKKDLLLDFE